VGVSGGPDSVALLDFLRLYHERTGSPPGGIVAAHVNHGLRGAESDADEAFVNELANREGLRFLVSRVDPALRRSAQGESPEQAARALRYEALREMAARVGGDRAAVAHTADDQAETVLLRLIRGAGLAGLAGMQPRRRVHGLLVVRPLLTTTREQVLPLVMDLLNPSPDQGWRGLERRALPARGRPDLTLCLALVHHMAISANVPVESFLAWLGSLGTSLVIEFVGKEDPMVQQLLLNKDDTYDDYNRACFESSLKKFFQVQSSLELPAVAGGARILYYATPALHAR